LTIQAQAIIVINKVMPEFNYYNLIVLLCMEYVTSHMPESLFWSHHEGWEV